MQVKAKKMTSSIITSHDVKQGTPDWHLLRSGIITASNAHKLLTGGVLAAVEEVVIKDNYYMKRGRELEPEAIELYERINEVEVERPGFITNSKYTGCGVSPDGITDRLIEVKCFGKDKHLAIDEDNIPFEVMAQCQFGMMIVGLNKTDLVLYNPDLDSDVALKIITIKKDVKIHQRFNKILKEGRKGDMILVVKQIVGNMKTRYGQNVGNEYTRVLFTNADVDDGIEYYLNLPLNHKEYEKWYQLLKPGNMVRVSMQPNGKNVDFYQKIELIKEKDK